MQKIDEINKLIHLLKVSKQLNKPMPIKVYDYLLKHSPLVIIVKRNDTPIHFIINGVSYKASVLFTRVLEDLENIIKDIK